METQHPIVDHNAKCFKLLLHGKETVVFSWEEVTRFYEHTKAYQDIYMWVDKQWVLLDVYMMPKHKKVSPLIRKLPFQTIAILSIVCTVLILSTGALEYINAPKPIVATFSIISSLVMLSDFVLIPFDVILTQTSFVWLATLIFITTFLQWTVIFKLWGYRFIKIILITYWIFILITCTAGVLSYYHNP